MHGVAERDTDSSSAGIQVPEPDGRVQALPRLPEGSLTAIAVYAAVVLVVFPEGNPSLLARAAGLLVIAGIAAVAITVARWTPAWVRGLGMLLVGFGMVAVLAGVVVGRVVRDPSVGAVLGLVAGLGALCLVVVGWQRLLQGLRHRWIRMVTAVVATLLVAQFLLLPAVVALTATNRAQPEGSGAGRRGTSVSRSRTSACGLPTAPSSRHGGCPPRTERR